MRRLALWLALGSSGCATGSLYTHTVFPLTTDFRDTPVRAGPGASGSLTQIRYSWLDLRWDSNALGAIALEHGLARIDYADVEVTRILGIWNRSVVRIYGEPAASAEP